MAVESTGVHEADHKNRKKRKYKKYRGKTKQQSPQENMKVTMSDCGNDQWQQTNKTRKCKLKMVYYKIIFK
jgi:5-methylcytosine-specific restriction endonuclease McrA